jgi:hypothetical protein
MRRFRDPRIRFRTYEEGVWRGRWVDRAGMSYREAVEPLHRPEIDPSQPSTIAEPRIRPWAFGTNPFGFGPRCPWEWPCRDHGNGDAGVMGRERAWPRGGRRGPGSEDVRVLIANVETSDSADARGRKGLAHGRDGPGTEVVRSLGHRTGTLGCRPGRPGSWRCSRCTPLPPPLRISPETPRPHVATARRDHHPYRPPYRAIPSSLVRASSKWA